MNRCQSPEVDSMAIFGGGWSQCKSRLIARPFLSSCLGNRGLLPGLAQQHTQCPSPASLSEDRSWTPSTFFPLAPSSGLGWKSVGKNPCIQLRRLQRVEAAAGSSWCTAAGNAGCRAGKASHPKGVCKLGEGLLERGLWLMTN